uniref:Uncharacterized protein n=1 Tax=Arundo donax TaxID=35708 RepID=A0A0A9C447_ARUDO
MPVAERTIDEGELHSARVLQLHWCAWGTHFIATSRNSHMRSCA